MLLQELDAGVLYLTLNRAEKRNAFDRALYAALTEAIQQGDANPDVRVICITANGKCFSAGNDIADFLLEPEQGRRTDPPLKLLRALRNCRTPIVAQVHGKAVGIGATLLLHCDLVFASDVSDLVFPFVSLGLCPEGGSTEIVPKLAGHSKAFEWLVLGNSCSAKEAAEFGLINAVLPFEDLTNQVNQVLRRLAVLDPQSVQESKRLLKATADVQLDKVMQTEMDLFESLLEGEVAQQKLNAFIRR